MIMGDILEKSSPYELDSRMETFEEAFGSWKENDEAWDKVDLDGTGRPSSISVLYPTCHRKLIKTLIIF